MCGMDFSVNILVDENPQEITWEVVNEQGKVVANGECQPCNSMPIKIAHF